MRTQENEEKKKQKRKRNRIEAKEGRMNMAMKEFRGRDSK